MKFDNLQDLPVLLAVAETGSLTAAGKRCGLCTAAISAAVKRLEHSLGVRLFERTTRAIRLTPQGELMTERARRALDWLAEGQALARAGSLDLSGTIHISVAAVLAHELFAQWLTEFVDDNPGVVIDLIISDVQADIVREGLDISVRHGPLPDSNHYGRLLAPAHRIACASPEYLARRGTPKEPRDLAEHECLVYFARGRMLDTWHFERVDKGGEPIDVDVKGHMISDTSIVHRWALEGRGIVYQTEVAFIDALASGALVRLFPEWRGEPSPLYAVLPSKDYVPARVTELIRRLQALLAQRPALALSSAARNDNVRAQAS